MPCVRIHIQTLDACKFILLRILFVAVSRDEIDIETKQVRRMTLEHDA